MIFYIGSGASLTNVNLSDRTTSLLAEGTNLRRHAHLSTKLL